MTEWTANRIFPFLRWLGIVVTSLIQLYRCAWLLHSESSLLEAFGRISQCLLFISLTGLSIHVISVEVANKENKAIKSRGLFFTLLHLLRGIGITMISLQPLRSPTDKACGPPDIDIIQMMTYYQIADIFGFAPSGLMLQISLLELPWHMWLDYRYASLNLIPGSSTLIPFLKTRGLRLTGIRLMASILPVMVDSSNTYRQECQLVIFLLSGALLFKTALMIGIRFGYGHMDEGTWDIILPILAMFFFMSADYGSMLKLAHSRLEDMKTAVSQTFQKKSEQQIIQEVKDIANLVNAAGAPTEEGGVDKLVILESIGGGAHGTVFKGRWRGMDVAVKTVMFPYEHGSDRGNARQRAILEAGVSCSVVHPNIVTTYHWDVKAVKTIVSSQAPSPTASKPQSSGHGLISVDPSLEAHDWKLFLIQELCQASLLAVQDSQCLLKRKGPRAGQPLMITIYGALLDISKGLEYLHSKNIIHGCAFVLIDSGTLILTFAPLPCSDLKPENILAKTDQSKPHGFTCKITDFGVRYSIDLCFSFCLTPSCPCPAISHGGS
jgi:hypothetical protein